MSYISFFRISSYLLGSSFNIDIELVENTYLIYAILLILMIIIVPTFWLAYWKSFLINHMKTIILVGCVMVILCLLLFCVPTMAMAMAMAMI